LFCGAYLKLLQRYNLAASCGQKMQAILLNILSKAVKINYF